VRLFRQQPEEAFRDLLHNHVYYYRWRRFMQRQPTVLCLASYYKGASFLTAAKALGARVLLLTREKNAAEPWPRESIDEVFLMPDLRRRPDILYAVSYLTRANAVDAIVPLDDYDVETAAALREHLRLPGLGETGARYFRDKLAMRTQASAAGIPVPPFTPVFSYDRLRDYMARVPPPWVLKPRSEAGAMGIKKLYDAEQVWRWLDQLGDEQSFFHLEQFIPGEIYHVDSLVYDGRILFAQPHKYARPPLTVAHDGGVFVSRTLPDGDEARAILALNERLLRAFGLERGATHAEFIRGQDGQYYFLEVAARVGGANIEQLVEAASGLNLWGVGAHGDCLRPGSAVHRRAQPPRLRRYPRLPGPARVARPERLQRSGSGLPRGQEAPRRAGRRLA
jgi:biotin carboxylase